MTFNKNRDNGPLFLCLLFPPKAGIRGWAWLINPQNCVRFGEFGSEFFSPVVETYQHICFALSVQKWMEGEITYTTCQSQGTDSSELNNSYTLLENKMWRRSEERLPTECALRNACSFRRLNKEPGKCELMSSTWAPRLSLHKASMSCWFCAVKNSPWLVKWPTLFEIRSMPNFIWRSSLEISFQQLSKEWNKQLLKISIFKCEGWHFRGAQKNS